MRQSDASKGIIKSDITLLSIINELKELDRAGVTELANRLNLSKSAVHKHLKSLEMHDLVIKNTDSTYQLGFKFLTYGGYIRDNNELCQLVTQKMKQITDEITDTCGFAIEEGGYGVYTHLEWGEHHIPRTQPLGERFYLHSNSSGKAILSKLSTERVEAILDERGLPEQTPNTITTRDQLFEEIKRTKERGYAVNAEERFEGIRSVATAIDHPETGQVGAISIAAPATRLQDEQLEKKFADLLRNVSNEISLQIKFK